MLWQPRVHSRVHNGPQSSLIPSRSTESMPPNPIEDEVQYVLPTYVMNLLSLFDSVIIYISHMDAAVDRSKIIRLNIHGESEEEYENCLDRYWAQAFPQSECGVLSP